MGDEAIAGNLSICHLRGAIGDEAIHPQLTTRTAMINIRPERPVDLPAIRRLNTLAFGQSDEARLVDALRENCPDIISLVALDGDRLVGHILFSPVTLTEGGRYLEGLGLGPVAVLPAHQNQGIGTALIWKGINLATEQGSPFIVVLGHSGYYPRFGFQPASRIGIRSDWEVPDEAFMALVLDEAAMQGRSGVARYRPEFSS
ncbi:MAG: N-acetyltransferase [Anaerolineales bacterium]|nr:N-acetyltransferase [Anaerolineales bacterium]